MFAGAQQQQYAGAQHETTSMAVQHALEAQQAANYVATLEQRRERGRLHRSRRRQAHRLDRALESVAHWQLVKAKRRRVGGRDCRRDHAYIRQGAARA